MTSTPVTLVNALGRPVTNVQNVNGAVPMTVVDALGEPVTLVDAGGEPVTLLNPDGTLWGDLYRILALSPSLLIWPANGSGWQGTSGGTLSATGQPVGLLPDLAALQGKTQAEWLASAANIWNNASATVSGGTQALGGGVYRIYSSAGANSFVSIASVLTVGKLYEVKFTIDSIAVVGSGIRVADSGEIYTTTGAKSSLYRASGLTNAFIKRQAAACDYQISGIQFLELPGNHLRAGTWATPANLARATLRAGGGVTWLDPDATANAYSFLNALSARTVIARVRVPTGWSADDRFLTNDAESVNISIASDNWTNTGSGTTRINGASGTAFAVDTWQTLTLEYASAQAFSRLWFSATGSQFGSMDLACLAVFNGALSAGDRATAEAIVTATA